MASQHGYHQLRSLSEKFPDEFDRSRKECAHFGFGLPAMERMSPPRP